MPRPLYEQPQERNPQARRLKIERFQKKAKQTKVHTFSVVTLGPIVAGTRLAKNKVVWTIKLSERTGPNRVHGSRLEIDKYGARNIFAVWSFVVVNIDSFELKIVVAGVCARWINAMFVRDDFPELWANLIAALTYLSIKFQNFKLRGTQTKQIATYRLEHEEFRALWMRLSKKVINKEVVKQKRIKKRFEDNKDFAQDGGSKGFKM